MNEKTMDFEGDIVSGEQEIDIIEAEYEGMGESVLSKAGRLLFYAFIVLFPLWFLPTSFAPVELNKAYLSSILLIGSLMLTLGGMLQEGRVRFVSSKFFFVYIVFLLSVLASALFSLSPLASLWGLGIESFTFWRMLIAGLGLFLVPLVIKDSMQLKKALLLFSIPVALLFVFFILQSVFSVDIFRAWEFAQERSFNPFGSWNSLAIFFGFGASLALPFLGAESVLLKRLAALVLVFSLLGIFFTNFATAWIGIAVVSLFFVALSLSQRQQRSGVFAASLFLLLSAVLFILLSTTLSSAFSGAQDSFGRPQEIIPSLSSTFDVVKSSLSGSPIFGAGPNSFALLWEQFKNSEINNTIFWQTRFPAGVDSFLTLIAEAGVLGGFLFLLLTAWFLWSGVRALGQMDSSESIYVKSSFAGSLYLLLMFFLYSISFPLVLCMFIMIGFFFTASSFAGIIGQRNVYLFETKERGFVLSLLIIFLLVAGIGGIYFETTRYLGAIAYGKGIDTYGREGSVNTAESHIERAIGLDSTQSQYWRSVAELEFIKIQRALTDQSASPEDRGERFRNAYTKGRTAALQAIELGKNEPQNYLILAQIYETAIPQDISVADIALENYEKARKLAPKDPTILVDIARTHLAVADVTLLRGGGSTSQKIAADRREKAIPFLTDAIKLKSDYTQAYFTLSQIYVVEREIDKAIQNAEQTSQLVPNNVGVLFQLGLLYYQKENFDKAEQVLSRAITINPNYSNARYFRGLIYDRKNETAKALEDFRAIKELNSDNEEIARIITALESGKKAADVLSNPPPQDRKDLPLKDQEKETSKAPPKEVPGL